MRILCENNHLCGQGNLVKHSKLIKLLSMVKNFKLCPDTNLTVLTVTPVLGILTAVFRRYMFQQGVSMHKYSSQFEFWLTNEPTPRTNMYLYTLCSKNTIVYNCSKNKISLYVSYGTHDHDRQAPPAKKINDRGNKNTLNGFLIFEGKHKPSFFSFMVFWIFLNRKFWIRKSISIF